MYNNVVNNAIEVKKIFTERIYFGYLVQQHDK